MPVEYQIIIIYAATKKYLLDVAVGDIQRFESELFEYIDTKYPEIPEAIRTEKEMSKEIEEKLIKAIESFKNHFETEE
jgi:F-type H+-transporting ATPase subunit alpha